MTVHAIGRVHELKTDPDPFAALHSGKRVELRRDDRPGGFQAGDYLRLREHDRATNGYLGGVSWAQVTHVQKGYGLLPGYVALSLNPDVLAPVEYRCDGCCHEAGRDEDCALCCQETQRMCADCLFYGDGS